MSFRLRQVAPALPAFLAAYPEVSIDLRLNNRAEISHQPTRRRVWIMQRFKSPRQVRRFRSIHHQIANVFPRRPPPLSSTAAVRGRRATAMETAIAIRLGAEVLTCVK
jgi:transposase-like protein